MEEFYPLAHLNRLVRYWWVPVLTALVGGLLAYGFHLGRPPIYEASASIFASIDSTKTTHLDPVKYQYDEDISLAVIDRVMWDPATLQATLSAAQAQGIPLTAADMYKKAQTERMHATWWVRYRDPNPLTAQRVANLWIEQGYQALLEWRKTGKVVDYVWFEEPIPAGLPDKPILFGRNALVLAGGMLGLLAGLLLVEIMAQTGRLKGLPA